MTAYQVIYWAGTIKPHARNMSNLNDGAIFQHADDAEKLARRVVFQNGSVFAIREIPNASHWWESLEEYDLAGLMSADELAAIGRRGKTLIEAQGA